MPEENKRRTELNDLPREEEQELSADEQKQVKGGAIRKAVMNTGIAAPTDIDPGE